MTKKLADQIEKYLNDNLEPEHAYILFVSETPKSHAGIITNYSTDMMIKTLKQFSGVSVKKPKRKFND